MAKTTKQLIAEMDARFAEYARANGDEIQALRSRVTELEAESGGGGIGTGDMRRVAPPDNNNSEGQIGDYAVDGENFYIYLGNGITHKWGQSLLITEFSRI
jgi:hypothetical protein